MAETREPTTEEQLEMANGCLAMVAEVLAAHLGEHAVERTPPMFYPEAIQTAIHKRVNEVRDGLEAELAAARERIGALEGSLYELHRIVVGHQDTQGFTGRPRGSHVSWFVRNDVAWRIRDLTEDPLAAPTSAAHTGEGGEP